MKNIFTRLSVFFLALIGLISCETEPLDNGIEPTTPVTDEGVFSVKFNNSTYSTNNVQAILVQNKISLTAEDASGVFIFMIEGDQTGTYSGDDISMSYITPSGDTYTNLGESNATLAITAINYQQKTITGTFGFTGIKLDDSEEVISFTQGVFTNVSVTGNLVNPDPDPEVPEDPEDPDPEDPEDPEVPASEDYFPMAAGNIWNYSSNTTLNITSTASIAGNNYYKLGSAGFFLQDGHTSDSYLRKAEGDYFVRIENETYDLEGYNVNIDLVEYTILKDYLNEGDSWEETHSVNYTYLTAGEEYFQEGTVVVKGTIVAKDVSAEVNGVAYTEVIKIKMTRQTLLGLITTDIWYAKNIGVIYHYEIGPGFVKNSSLTDYSLE